MPRTNLRVIAALFAFAGFSSGSLFAQESALPKPADVKSIAVHPAKISLNGSDDAAQIVVTATLNNGRLQDLTHDVQYAVADPKLAAITTFGRVLPRANGASEITAVYANHVVK
ncbi:MAG TPA: hypothetical protein VGI99_07355, partial [Gemmataceae bacterium]